MKSEPNASYQFALALLKLALNTHQEASAELTGEMTALLQTLDEQASGELAERARKLMVTMQSQDIVEQRLAHVISLLEVESVDIEAVLSEREEKGLFQIVDGQVFDQHDGGSIELF